MNINAHESDRTLSAEDFSRLVHRCLEPN